MCDCIQKIQENLNKELSNKGLEIAQEPKLEATFFTEKNDLKQTTFTNVKYAVVKRFKNGNSKVVKQKTVILHTYCPFCGKKKE